DAAAVRRNIDLGDRSEGEEVGRVHAVGKTTPPMTDAARSQWVFSKTEAVATNGIVTADPLAAEAGVEILRDGGNALDAALATAFALGVTSPIGSGLGGIAGLVVWHEGKTSSFDGSTRAPLASRPEMFELTGGEARSGMYGWPAVKNDANVEGPLSVTVPGAVAAYEAGAPPPNAIEYRGHRVLTLPGLTGGPTVARALGLLEREDLRKHRQLGAESLHRIAVAVRAAFAERLGSMADMPNTTHVNAVDRDRMCVALTATLGGGFGSAVLIKGTGIVLTNGTYWFDPRPGRPNSNAPGHR